MSPQDRQRRRQASPEYGWLLDRLDQFRRYLKTMSMLEATVSGTLALLVLAPALFLLDNWLHFATTVRLASCLALVGAAVASLQFGVRMALQPWGYERLAIRIEERFPELQNSLINAVQLGYLDEATPGIDLIRSIVNQCIDQVRAMRLRRAVNTQRLKRAAAASLVLALIAAAYPILLPAYFRNAALRILLPTSGIEPLTRTHLAIKPGDATVGRGESLTITAIPSGALPRSARLQMRGETTRGDFAMGFDGQQFEYELADIQKPLSYRVEANDYSSPWHTVLVLVKPRISRISVKIDYPEYTRLSPAVIDPSDGNVTALTGSKATITAWTNKPIREARLLTENGVSAFPVPQEDAAPLEEGQEAAAPRKVSRLEAQVPITADTAYRWLVSDEDQLTNQPEPQYTIRATPDAPPRVVITSPRGEMEVPQGDEVPILFSASDDYGLSRVTLTEQVGDKHSALFERRFEQPDRLISEGVVLQSKLYAVDDEIHVVLDATDNNPAVPGQAATDPVILKIVAPRVEAQDAAQAGLNFATELLALLTKQREARAELKLWTAGLGSKTIEAETLAGALKKITLDQSQIRTTALQMLEIKLPDASEWEKALAALKALTENEMRAASEQLKAIDPAAEPKAVSQQSNAVAEIQNAIIAKLSDLLESLREAFPELKDVLVEEEKKLDEERKNSPDSWPDAYGKLLDFIDDQQGVLSSLQKMEDIDPKNLSNEQKMEMEDLAKKEDEWSEYFKDCADWLRKSPMVDGTESGLRDELIEMYQEIEKLPEELRSTPVTIPVDEETVKNGLELATELTHNLEKWLAEEPDYQKWELENSSTPYDVPLAQLPDELEDQMGELLEQEQDMWEGIEDQTSNWADSLDAGAGWQAMDGPISNYSAKGVTGNLQPNDMDISGRSGEGRSGRSLGEMVESVATGKGGRDTQTRITADAMGAGVVEDLSTEEVKGATGGGKIAGTTGYGLTAANAPEQPELIQKMSQRQADLKMKAMNLSEALKNMQLPTGHVDQAVRGMEQIEKTLAAGRYDNLKDLHAVVVSDLKDQRSIVREQMKMRSDPSFGQRNQFQHDIRQGEQEQFPDEYKKLLSAYYQALSQQNWQGQ